jgi:hypothetical protein
MKIRGIRAVALLVLPVVWLQTSHAAENAGSPLQEEIENQEKIYRSKGEQIPDGYIISRSLLSYAHTLSPAFDRSLAELGPKDRWLDIGAGSGQAILDYYESRYDRMHYGGQERPDRKAQAVAISIEDRRTPLWQTQAASLGNNRIRYLSGRRLREYTAEELGQFEVITDVLGGFSYAINFSLFMEKVLAFLTVDGSFYTLLQDVHAEDGKNRPYYKGSPFLTEIVSADGAEVKVCAWLKSIACVEVTCEPKPDWQPPIEAFRIRKVCNDVVVPALTTVHYVAGTPPERGFKLGK